jgi:hypothetical protein
MSLCDYKHIPKTKRVAFSCQVNLVVMTNSWVELLVGFPFPSIPTIFSTDQFFLNFKLMLALAHSPQFLGLLPFRSRSQLRARYAVDHHGIGTGRWQYSGQWASLPNLLECSKRVGLTLGQGLWGLTSPDNG